MGCFGKNSSAFFGALGRKGIVDLYDLADFGVFLAFVDFACLRAKCLILLGLKGAKGAKGRFSNGGEKNIFIALSTGILPSQPSKWEFLFKIKDLGRREAPMRAFGLPSRDFVPSCGKNTTLSPLFWAELWLNFWRTPGDFTILSRTMEACQTGMKGALWG